MKPFDLEKAKAGAPVCTRDGRKARIICFDANNEQSIVALIAYKDNREYPKLFSKNGFWRQDEVENKNDLVMAPAKHEGWINIYHKCNNYCKESIAESGCVIYATEQEAKSACRLDGGSPMIATVKIEWEE